MVERTRKDNYPAALSYLSLIYDEQQPAEHVSRLKNASTSEFKARDIFRTSGLSLLGINNDHVEKDER